MEEVMYIHRHEVMVSNGTLPSNVYKFVNPSHY